MTRDDCSFCDSASDDGHLFDEPIFWGIKNHDGITLLLNRDMGIDHGGIKTGMSEQLADSFDLDAFFVETCGEGMSEGVTMDIGSPE